MDSITKPKILFVQPSQIEKDKTLWKSKLPWLPRLALPQLAALTSNDFNIKIVDEYIENINFNEQADLVAITATTSQAPRAYQISEEFRKRGRKTIIGGIHASLLPDEAKHYADSIFIGEAEGLWSEVLQDLTQHNLKPVYINNAVRPDISHIPSPKMDALNLNKYNIIYRPVQTTRGCPHDCHYCSVTTFFGKSYRHRDIGDIVKELELLNARRIFFVDDNITANPARAKKLFQAIKPLKINWMSQTCMSIAYNDELLELAKESGCSMLMLGLESLSQKNLGSVNKSINKVDDYFYVIDKLHSYGISVLTFMIFGFDHDDSSVFEKTVKFIEDAKVDYPCFWILTPLPGTPLFQKMDLEKRIIERDWSRYDGSHVVFKPELMSPEELQQGYDYAYKRAYSLTNLSKRIINLSISSVNMTNRLILKGDITQLLLHSFLFRQGAMGGYHPMKG